MDTYQPAPNLSLLPDSLGSHVQELTSAVDLKFLSFLRHARQRNFKSKTANYRWRVTFSANRRPLRRIMR
ncbi:MAG: hypothetical protein WB756_23390, partial [Xanthobacteraceae bacterium]